MYCMQWSRSAGLCERPGLVEDDHRRVVALHFDALDVVEAVLHQRVQLDRGLDAGLPVKRRRVRDLEQHVLDHVAAERPLETERLALEQHVVEAPGLRRQRGGITHLALQRHQREAHAAARGVARRPRFARARCWACGGTSRARGRRPTRSTRALTISSRVPPSIFVDHRGDGNLDEYGVIEARRGEAVLEREAAHDFVGLDRRFEHVAHQSAASCPPPRACATASPRSRESAESVGRMDHRLAVERVVAVEPANHRADVERGVHRVEHERRARHARAVRHDGAGHDRPEQAWCSRETTAPRVRSRGCRSAQ